MKLKLTEKYVITTDDRNVILNRNGTVKDGKTKGKKIVVPIGYYSSFQKAVSGALFHGLKESDVAGLKAIIRHIEDFEATAIEYLEKLGLK